MLTHSKQAWSSDNELKQRRASEMAAAAAVLTAVYATEALPSSVNATIFLAGPTPRGGQALSWRREAVSVLQDEGFTGHVFIPEHRSGQWHGDYLAQVCVPSCVPARAG